jgi:hypothetical protein
LQTRAQVPQVLGAVGRHGLANGAGDDLAIICLHIDGKGADHRGEQRRYLRLVLTPISILEVGYLPAIGNP